MREFLLRENYSGRRVITGAGVVLLGSVPFWLLFGFYGAGRKELTTGLVFFSLLIGGVSFIDDVNGSGEYRGFRGHFRALQAGRLTTGAFKAVISAVAVVIFFVLTEGVTPEVVVDVLLVLSVVNLFNLLDLRPGRALKVFIVLSLLIALSFPLFQLYFLPPYIIIILYLPFELRERVMLGDTGANLLGLLVGFSLANRVGVVVKLFALVLAVSLNLLSERYSFTEIIARNHLLSFLDELGRI